MGKMLQFEAGAERVMAAELERVWTFLVTLPGAFGEFPMIHELTERSDGSYHLCLGHLGFGRWTMAAQCVIRPDLSDKPILRFLPVEGEGNTHAEFEMHLAPVDGGTHVMVHARVRPQMAVPSGTPVGLICRVTAAAMTATLERTLQRVERRCIQTAQPAAFHAT